MIRIKRVIFDEIDTISTMIQTRIQSDYVWFVSASFKNDRIGTYYSNIKDDEIDRVTLRCEEEFIRQEFPLEDPIVFKYVSVNKYVDETLVGLVGEEELKGINALDYTKIKNDYFKIIPNKDDGATELVVEDNRNEIEFLKIRLDDMKKDMERLKVEVTNDGLDYEDIEEEDNNTDPRIKMILEYNVRIEKDEDRLRECEMRRELIREKVVKNRLCMICFGDIENKSIKEIFRSECCKTDFCVDCIHYLFEVKKREYEMKKKEEELKNKQNLKQTQSQSQSQISIETTSNSIETTITTITSTLTDESQEINYDEWFKDLDICCKKCDKKGEYKNYKKMRMVKRRNKEEKAKDRTSKIERFEYILQQNNAEKKKYIVFSDFYNTFNPIKDLLEKMNIKFLELDGGSIESIDNSVKEYREGESQVLLSNSTFFGCGLNMEFTSDIIFMHKMEIGTERQVIGRAQRPGRTSQLRIHYIYYNNEEYGKDVEYESHTQFYGEEDILQGLEGLDIKEVVLE
jgi:hypothetical protein